MKKARILIIEHAEGRAGSMPELIQAANAVPTVVGPYKGEALPSPQEFDAIISGGGPMGVHEMHLPQYSFLEKEVHFIRAMIAGGKAVLGICLGHELLAHILGGKVQPSPANKEVGWSKISLTGTGSQDSLLAGIAEEFWAFQYHNDHVESLPPGAILLARTPKCPIQAFRYSTKPVWGVQFHPEISAERAQEILSSRRDILEKEGVDVSILIKEGFAVDHGPRKQIFYNFIQALS